MSQDDFPGAVALPEGLSDPMQKVGVSVHQKDPHRWFLPMNVAEWISLIDRSRGKGKSCAACPRRGGFQAESNF
jgi:hypothetical protein